MMMLGVRGVSEFMARTWIVLCCELAMTRSVKILSSLTRKRQASTNDNISVSLSFIITVESVTIVDFTLSLLL